MTTSPTASQSQVSTSSATHSMPNMDMRHMFAVTSPMLHLCHCLRAVMSFVWADITLPTSTKHQLNTGITQPVDVMSFVWVDITLPTSTNHQLNTGTTQIDHQLFLILQSWLETLTAIILTRDIRRLI